MCGICGFMDEDDSGSSSDSEGFAEGNMDSTEPPVQPPPHLTSKAIQDIENMVLFPADMRAISRKRMEDLDKTRQVLISIKRIWFALFTSICLYLKISLDTPHC